jgi:hypothetical protein
MGWAGKACPICAPISAVAGMAYLGCELPFARQGLGGGAALLCVEEDDIWAMMTIKC